MPTAIKSSAVRFSLPADRTVDPEILGDLPDRRLDRLADDLDADLLVAIRSKLGDMEVDHGF